MNALEILDSVEELANELVKSMTLVHGDDVGLDYRCGPLYVCEDGIAVLGCARSVEYYGGFEYIDSDHVTKVSRVTFYSVESDRVRECVECWEETQK